MIYGIRESRMTPPPVDHNAVISECNAIFENGTYIKDCNYLITETMVEECMGDRELIEAAAILEGAKLDMALKNFLKEGKDYKGLKKDLKEIIKANDMSEAELKTGKKGFMHICKRILQVCYDLTIPFSIGYTATTSIGTIKLAGAMGAGAAAAVPVVVGAILGFVIGFIINRLIRWGIDTIEFSAISKDSLQIIEELEEQAKKCNDPKLKKKYEDSAEKLKESLKKYSK